MKKSPSKPSYVRTSSAKSIILLLALIGLGTVLDPHLLSAAERLANIFGDNMVLQRDRAVPIWGWAGKGQVIKVVFGSQEKTVTADENGCWMVRLDPMPANKNPQELKVTGAASIVVKNVLVGEVWICSGQSNMEMALRDVLNFEAEKNAAEYPNLRTATIGLDHRPLPQDEMNHSPLWLICSPKTVGVFTAVGYFFGRELFKTLDVPIGLISTSVSGTRIEPWICPEGFRAVPELKALSDQVDGWLPTTDAGRKRYQDYFGQLKTWILSAESAVAAKRMIPAPPQDPWAPNDIQQPTRLYNAMVHPLVPYAVRGAIWYQGEANGGEGMTYFHKMRALIGGWRQLWGQGHPSASSEQAFSFYFVQLANYQKSDPNKPEGNDGYGFARLREAQLKSLAITNTGMAVTIDIGDANNIHPRNKQDVGKRLALWALAKDYQQTIPYSGPLYKGC